MRPGLILAVYVVAFTVGTVTHAAHIVRYGIFPRNQKYGSVLAPLPTKIADQRRQLGGRTRRQRTRRG